MRLKCLGIASLATLGLALTAGCSPKANAKANPDFPVPDFAAEASANKGRSVMPIPSTTRTARR